MFGYLGLRELQVCNRKDMGLWIWVLSVIGFQRGSRFWGTPTACLGCSDILVETCEDTACNLNHNIGALALNIRFFLHTIPYL